MTVGDLVMKFSCWLFICLIIIGACIEIIDGPNYGKKAIIYGIVIGTVVTYVFTGGLITFFEWIKPFMDMKIL